MAGMTSIAPNERLSRLVAALGTARADRDREAWRIECALAQNGVAALPLAGGGVLDGGAFDKLVADLAAARDTSIRYWGDIPVLLMAAGILPARVLRPANDEDARRAAG